MPKKAAFLGKSITVFFFSDHSQQAAINNQQRSAAEGGGSKEGHHDLISNIVVPSVPEHIDTKPPNAAKALAVGD